MSLMEPACPDLKWLPATILMLFLFCASAQDSRECLNGFLLPDGTCDCYSCWTGESCSQYASRPPKFGRSFDTSTLSPTDDDLTPKSIYKAVALDPDEEFCKEPEGCSCSKVTYFIVSQEETSNFWIDKNTGDLMLNGDRHSLYPEYQLTLGAADDGASYDTLTLVIETSQGWDGTAPGKYMMAMADGSVSPNTILDFPSANNEERHSRHRRAVIALPDKVTFTLIKQGLTQNDTEIRTGTRMQFRLDILFPKSTTDIQVELFAPDSDNTVMMLCNVIVQAGANLAVSGVTVPEMEALDNSQHYDRAIIRLGTVSNNASDLTNTSPSTITIVYEAVMIENTKTLNNQEYWVSAGAEMDNQTNIWVGQAKVITSTDDDSSSFNDPPVVTFSGEQSLAVGSCANYTIDLTLNRPVVDLKFDVYAPLTASDVMSICTAKVVSVNEAYQCGLSDLWDYIPDYISDGNAQGYKRVHIDLGRPVNKLARDYALSPSDLYKGVITFGLQVCMNDNSKLVSQEYYLGSSVQIGTDIIWAGQLKVTAAVKQLSQALTPKFNMTLPSGNGISQTVPVLVQLDMEVPETSHADYELEIMAPLRSGEAIFQVCTVRVVFVGENMACLAQLEFDPVYSITSNLTTSIYPDVAKVTLGSITNLGTLGWSHSNFSDNKNTMTFEIIFKATDHPDASVGSIHDIYFGMFVGTGKLTIGRTNLTVVADTPTTTLTEASKPQINLALGGDGNSVLPIGKTAQLLLDIRTFPNTIYSPFTLEFIMPNNTDMAMVKICKVKVQSVGANNPCVVALGVEKSVEMLSSFSEDVVDRAVINMSSLCNVQRVANETEDHVVIAANVVLRNHPQFLVDKNAWISAGIMYSQKFVSVARLQLQANLGSQTASLKQEPIMMYGPNNGYLNSIPRGYPARHLVRIKVAPRDSTPLSLSVSTLDDSLSVCNVRVVRAGSAFPCLETVIGNITNENQQLGITKGGSLDMGFVGNIGADPLVSSYQWDSNTIEVEIVTKVSLDSTLAPDGSTHMFEVLLNFDTGYTKQLTATVTVTATSNVSLKNDTSFASGAVNGSTVVASITGQDTPLSMESLTTIVKSESKRIVISVQTTPNTISQLTVTATTPTNIADVMEILYIGVLDAGDNLICVTPGLAKATYIPRNTSGTYADIGSLELGYVCNLGLVTNDTTGTANRLRIESVVRVLSSATVSPGTVLQVHGAITSNNKEMWVYSVSLTLGDGATYEAVSQDLLNQSAAVVHNSTEDPIQVAISQMKTFPIVFTVPPFSSSKIQLDAVMPVNTSAIMTLTDVKFVGSGKNIPALEKEQSFFTNTMSSEHNTSQVTRYQLIVGVVSNPGVTHKHGHNVSDDDTFTVLFTVQMADNAAATDGSKHKVSFGLHLANVVLILDIYVTVVRTRTESLEFDLVSEVDLVNSTSNVILVDTSLSLSNRSTAEGQDSILVVLMPVYTAFVSAVVTSPLKNITSIDYNNNAVTLNFGPLFFTDRVNLTTTIAANSSYAVPLGVTGHDSVLALQPVANTHTSTDTVGPIQYVNFTITTTQKGSTECTLAPLGMESGALKDCQLSSSPDSLLGSEADKGRYNTGTGWSPFVHTGQVKTERFFQVYFGSQVLVSRLKVQQTGPAFASQLGLRYSNDGLAWVESSNQLFPTAGVTDEALDISSPQAARYLRVMIVSLNNEKQTANFRFEFIGCETKSDGPADTCSAVVKDSTKLSEFTRRTFILAGSTLFICDGIKSQEGIQQICYLSRDGRTWQKMDTRVGGLLGYDTGEPRLYAVSASGECYMSSISGDDWFSMGGADVTKATSLTTFKHAVVVPVDGDNKLNSAAPDAAYTDSIYGATVDGLMVSSPAGWTTIFSWSTCC